MTPIRTPIPGSIPTKPELMTPIRTPIPGSIPTKPELMTPTLTAAQQTAPVIVTAPTPAVANPIATSLNQVPVRQVVNPSRGFASAGFDVSRYQQLPQFAGWTPGQIRANIIQRRHAFNQRARELFRTNPEVAKKLYPNMTFHGQWGMPIRTPIPGSIPTKPELMTPILQNVNPVGVNPAVPQPAMAPAPLQRLAVAATPNPAVSVQRPGANPGLAVAPAAGGRSVSQIQADTTAQVQKLQQTQPTVKPVQQVPQPTRTAATKVSDAQRFSQGLAKKLA